MEARRNFTGCMENVWFNHMDIIKDTHMEQPRFQIHGPIVLGLCQSDPIVPYTFPNVDAHLELSTAIAQRLRIGFDFRSYNKDGLLFTTSLSPGGRVMMKLNTEGHLEYLVDAGDDETISNVITNRKDYIIYFTPVAR